jgi:hypothetical protein
MAQAWQSGMEAGKYDSQSSQHVTISVCAKKFQHVTQTTLQPIVRL